MVENLIKKVIEEAESKAKNIIEKAEKQLEEKWKEVEKKVEEEFETLLKQEKENIDREVERELINFKLKKEKEILSIKNSFIEEVEKKIEEKFNQFFNENFAELVKKSISGIKENVKILIPEDKDLKIENAEISKDASLKNTFIIEGKNWNIVFSWERIKESFKTEIREKIIKFLFSDEQKRTT